MANSNAGDWRFEPMVEIPERWRKKLATGNSLRVFRGVKEDDLGAWRLIFPGRTGTPRVPDTMSAEQAMRLCEIFHRMHNGRPDNT